MGSIVPYRIDLFDDEIDSIRSFDIDTQRSLYPVNDVQLLPGREFPMDEDARTRFRSRFREVFEGDPSRCLPYKDVGNGIAFAGIEYYLPLFFEETATLFDYLKPETITITLGDLEDTIARFHSDTGSRYNFIKSDRERPVLPPEQLFLSRDQIYNQFKNFARLNLDNKQDSQEITPAPDVAVARRAEQPFAKLQQMVLNKQHKILLCADSAGRRETLLQMLQEHQLVPDTRLETIHEFIQSNTGFGMVVAPINTGFLVQHLNIVLLTENDL